MIDPKARAEMLRKKLMKENKYLLSRIGGAGQDPGERKILSDYFRYKDYIDDPEWVNSNNKERWSAKFLGLGKNGFKLTEFQNPTYSAAFNLKRDLSEFTKVFTLQVAGCNYSCNYCFVPRELNSGSEKYGKFYSARVIVDEILNIKVKSETPMNIIRVSGGECLIVPEIITDLFEHMMKSSPGSYLWIDTNLSNIEIIKKHGSKLKKILSHENVGIVGCFKGTTKEDFSLITGADEKFYKDQCETAKTLIDLGADLYAYIPAYVYCENEAENKLNSFFSELQNIDKNFPLRLEMLKIEDFPAAKINFELAKKEGRAIPETSQKTVFDLWYNKILPAHYPRRDLQKFCCEIRLQY